MDNPENKENKNIKINSENTTSEDSEKKQINKIKYQKNLDFIKEIINKYKFLENLKTGVSNLEKEENIYQLVDLFRIALILFDEKFNE